MKTFNKKIKELSKKIRRFVAFTENDYVSASTHEKCYKLAEFFFHKKPFIIKEIKKEELKVSDKIKVKK